MALIKLKRYATPSACSSKHQLLLDILLEEYPGKLSYEDVMECMNLHATYNAQQVATYLRQALEQGLLKRDEQGFYQYHLDWDKEYERT